MLLDTSDCRKCYFLDNIRDDLYSVTESLWNARDRVDDDNVNHVPVREDEKEAIQPLLDKGYEHIGDGNARIVLRFPDELDNYVVKLGRFGMDPSSIGMWQNHNEISLWSKYHSNSYPLVPIMDWRPHNVKWIIMPYGKPMSELDKTTEEIDDMLSEPIQKLRELDKLSTIEFVPENFILHNNKPMLADYGSHEYGF